MYDASYSNHRYSIVSVTKENTNGTVNIKDDFYTYGGSLAAGTYINFIILDKSINHVNYDIYRTTTNNSYEINFKMFFIAGIVILIAVITIVLMLVLNHNRKIENKPKTKKPIKKIIFGIIIGILVLIAIVFAIVSFEALMIPNMTAYKTIKQLYQKEEVTVKLIVREINYGYFNFNNICYVNKKITTIIVIIFVVIGMLVMLENKFDIVHKISPTITQEQREQAIAQIHYAYIGGIDYMVYQSGYIYKKTDNTYYYFITNSETTFAGPEEEKITRKGNIKNKKQLDKIINEFEEKVVSKNSEREYVKYNYNGQEVEKEEFLNEMFK